MTPPIRTTNPIILNSTFNILGNEKKKEKSVEIGLFSISPPPFFEDSLDNLMQSTDWNESTFVSSDDDVNSIYISKKKILPIVEEDDEVFHLD